MICVSSNSYAELLQDRYKYSYQYYPKEGLNRINFKIFMVIVVYMSLHPRDDYTHTGIQTRFFSSEFIQRVPMSRNVFSSILTFLHVSGIDPCKIDPTDRLYKVRFLLDRLKANCIKLYQPSQHVLVDERMVKNKGRFICKQYVRMRPTKWGFKLWVLCDSANGYTWNFLVYRGKAGEAVSSKGLSEDVIINMVEGLENQGYIIYTDNFYSSPTLFTDLVNKGFGAVGTIDHTRRGCPAALGLQKKKMLRQAYQRGYGVWIRNESIVFCLWRDTKVVCVASTIHLGNSNHQVKRRVKTQARIQEISVPIPDAIYDYNKHMGGVDLSDQLFQYFQTRRQTHKYWKTLFYHCIDIATTNASILYRERLSQSQRSKYDHKGYLRSLVQDLLSTSSTLSVTSPSGRPPRSDVRAQHRLKYGNDRKYCTLCKLKKQYYHTEKIA